MGDLHHVARDLLQALLILKVAALGPVHGYAIAQVEGALGQIGLGGHAIPPSSTY